VTGITPKEHGAAGKPAGLAGTNRGQRKDPDDTHEDYREGLKKS